MEFNEKEIDHESLTHFPDLKDAIFEQSKRHVANSKCSLSGDQIAIHCMKKLELIREACFNYHPSKLSGLLHLDDSLFEGDDSNLEKLIAESHSRWHAPNEFFTIFDINQGIDVYIDPRIEDILGFEVDNFNSANEKATDPELSLYYWDDIFHSMRHALTCYGVMSIPGFNWVSERDHYMARFRINTRHSSIESLKNKQCVLIEKRCYFKIDSSSKNFKTPRYHFDKYTVFSDLNDEFVFRTFVSTESQSALMNTFAYLFNAYLLGLAPKFILMLEARQTNDRNKAVAMYINSEIYRIKGTQGTVCEHKVADCFAKTIRHRIEHIYNQWDRRRNNQKITINSDILAVFYAKKLGLLPIPEGVKNIFYSLVS